MMGFIVVVVSGAAAQRLSFSSSKGVYRTSKDDYDYDDDNDGVKGGARSEQQTPNFVVGGASAER